MILREFLESGGFYSLEVEREAICRVGRRRDHVFISFLTSVGSQEKVSSGLGSLCFDFLSP
jgi:hypothetical protein